MHLARTTLATGEVEAVDYILFDPKPDLVVTVSR
jgi:hypothetical protein